jgi:hypothetical protein
MGFLLILLMYLIGAVKSFSNTGLINADDASIQTVRQAVSESAAYRRAECGP